MAMAVTVTGNPITDSKLRTWLQDALQLHGRVTFASAIDAARAFREVLQPEAERTLEALALQTVIRQLCGEPDATIADDMLPRQRAS
jgi:hypothetical protein